MREVRQRAARSDKEQPPALKSILIGWLLVAVAAHAADPAYVTLPAVKAGDRWTYARMDYWTNTREFVYEIQVTFANGDVIQGTSTRPGGKREKDGVWTAEWNSVAEPGGAVFEPNRELLRFPMAVGNEHKLAYTGKALPNVNTLTYATTKNELTAKVVGWEDVTVPAGTFHALRIDADGYYERLDRSVSGRAHYVVWYVPEVKRWVKLLFENWSNDRPFYRRGEELMRYSIQ